MIKIISFSFEMITGRSRTLSARKPLKNQSRNKLFSQNSRLLDAQMFRKSVILIYNFDRSSPKAPSKSEEILLSLRGCGAANVPFGNQDSPEMVDFQITEYDYL